MNKDKIFQKLLKPKNNEIEDKIFDYFRIEKTENETLLLGDFADKDFCHWLQFIHDGIQKALNEKLINSKKIENYVNITFYLGGQRVDISIIKDGCKSPHELLHELKTETKKETKSLDNLNTTYSHSAIEVCADMLKANDIKPLVDHIHCPNCSYPIYKKDFDEVPDEINALLNGSE